MVRSRTLILIACLALCSAGALLAQPANARIVVRGIYHDNAVWLRWVPGNFETWQWANQHEGYLVERYVLQDNTHYLTPDEMAASRTVLTDKASPEQESAWEVMPDSTLAGIVAGTLYGDSLETIDWSSPNLLQIANIGDVRENRFGFCLFACDQNFDIAKSAGLGWFDPEATTGYEYLYVVMLNGTDVKGVGTVSTTAQVLPPPPKPRGVGGDRRALLSWDETGLVETYSSYRVERSDNNGESWTVLNAAPVMPLSSSDQKEEETYLDSLPNNTTTYTYRITGRSPFGISGPPSDTVRIKGIPAPLVEAPRITACDEPTMGAIRTTWAFPINQEPLLLHFELFRSDQINGTYQKIGQFGPSLRQAVDPNPLPANYYLVKAKDVNGAYVMSLPRLGQVKDITPPAAPVALKGRCDRAGLVTVSWAPNPELDILGYRVYTSDQPVADSLFVQVTGQPGRDTFFRFRISLQTLVPKIYVHVRALDRHENPSLPSMRIAITRPDIIPPAAPLITKVTPLPQGVQFEVLPSASDDVVRYAFQKRREGTPTWVTWAEYTPATFPKVCIDSLPYVTDPVSRRRWHQYRLVAYDGSDNAGGSAALRTKPLDQGIREPIKNLTISYGGPGTLLGGVRLNWSHTSDPDLIGFQIYRAIDTSQMRSHQFISVATAAASAAGPGPWGFGDQDVNLKSLVTRAFYVKPALTAGGLVTYVPPTAINKPINTTPQTFIVLRYQVVAVYVDGAQSPVSQEVQVVIQ